MKLIRIIVAKLSIWWGFLRWGWLFNRSNTVTKEIEAVKQAIKDYNINDVYDIMRFVSSEIKYKYDKLNTQAYAFETLKRKYGDCEDIHRVAQLMLFLTGESEKPFLVYAFNKKYGHSFTLFKIGANWHAINYGNLHIDGNLYNIINEVMHNYDSSDVYYFEVRDIYLRKVSSVGL